MAGTPALREKYHKLREQVRSLGLDPDKIGDGQDLEEEALWKVAEESIGVDASIEEVCSLLRMNEKVVRKTLLERAGLSFEKWMEDCKARARANLRASQYRVACAGDRTLLIHLGRVLLNQRESQAQQAPIQVLVMPKEDGSVQLIDAQTGSTIDSKVITPKPKKP